MWGEWPEECPGVGVEVAPVDVSPPLLLTRITVRRDDTVERIAQTPARAAVSLGLATF